jgi:hypothetical protein
MGLWNAVVAALPYSIVFWNCSDSVIFFSFFSCYLNYIDVWQYTCITVSRGPRGRDRMVVGITNICAISAYHH